MVAALMATTCWTFTCAAERVDLLLVLAADVSRSMDEEKFQVQRAGYAVALSDPWVIEAIRAGPSRRVAVAFVEWSGPLSQKIVIDWTDDGWYSQDAFAHRESAEFPFPVHLAYAPAQPIRRVPFV